jgi:ArsR family transcriptional regulator
MTVRSIYRYKTIKGCIVSNSFCKADNSRNAMSHDMARDQLAERLAALAHPYRLRILEELGRQECACCGEVVSALPIAQSTVSQHLKILAKAGLISVDNAGQKSLYRVNAKAVTSLLNDVQALKSCCQKMSNADNTELPKD